MTEHELLIARIQLLLKYEGKTPSAKVFSSEDFLRTLNPKVKSYFQPDLLKKLRLVVACDYSELETVKIAMGVVWEVRFLFQFGYGQEQILLYGYTDLIQNLN
jgi:hypothetical protein